MVLVSILGDFHSSILPVFYEFKEKIKHHIILHDDSKYDKKHAKKLIQAQKDFIKQYKDDKKIDFKLEQIAIDEDCYTDILLAYGTIIKKTKSSKDIYLNATDGLSSIAIVLSHKLLAAGANVISYDRFANTYNLHTKNNMIKKSIKNNMDIKNHLKLKGYKLKSYKTKFELKNKKETILQITKNLTQFKEFATHYEKTQSKNKKGYYRRLIEKLGNDSVSYIQGGVFEEMIYWILKDNLKVDDIMTGVHVEFEKDVTNEIDILFIKDNHLHTIECKFGAAFSTSLHLYKTDSVMDYIDDDGKGMIFSIGEKYVGWQDRARADNDNIKVLTVKEFDKKYFLEQVAEHFGLEYK